MKYFILLITSLLFAQCPQVVDKAIKGRGVFKDPSPQVAMEMATLIAQDDLAKKVLAVQQKEMSKLTERSFSSKITTTLSGSIDGFSIVSKDYDAKSSRAEVFVELSQLKVNEILCK